MGLLTSGYRRFDFLGQVSAESTRTQEQQAPAEVLHCLLCYRPSPPAIHVAVCDWTTTPRRSKMSAVAKRRKRKPAGGRPPLPEGERRVRYALRFHPELLREFRAACRGKPRGEATRVIEAAIRAYVRKHGKEKRHGR